jgi:hypothetical protein
MLHAWRKAHASETGDPSEICSAFHGAGTGGRALRQAPRDYARDRQGRRDEKKQRATFEDLRSGRA